MSSITILGTGTWSLSLSYLLCNNGHSVTLWSPHPEKAERLRRDREDRKNLPGVMIPEYVLITDRMQEAVKDAEIIIIGTASVYVRDTAAKLRAFYRKGQIIVNVAKGIEEGTLKLLSEQIAEEIPGSEIAVLSGPSHAEEVSRGIPTTCVIGCSSKQKADYLQKVFMSPVFRVYTSPDLTGIEIGGALKNVIALAAGMADGLGYGDNTKAALITRGMAEISRLGMAMGGRSATFYGLSGMGDLIVTCASVHSRNRKAGYLIGQGDSAEEAMKKVGQVVEGVYSTKAAMALAEQYGVSMPIVTEVYNILFAGKPAAQAVEDLMLRDKRIENSDLNWQQ